MSRRNSPAAKAARRESRREHAALQPRPAPQRDACIWCGTSFRYDSPEWKYGAALAEGYLCAGCNFGCAPKCPECGEAATCPACVAGRRVLMATGRRGFSLARLARRDTPELL